MGRYLIRLEPHIVPHICWSSSKPGRNTPERSDTSRWSCRRIKGTAGLSCRRPNLSSYLLRNNVVYICSVGVAAIFQCCTLVCFGEGLDAFQWERRAQVRRGKNLLDRKPCSRISAAVAQLLEARCTSGITAFSETLNSFVMARQSDANRCKCMKDGETRMP
ncbi:hypothetical protein CDAR_23521 [Caerostris darwini]|uniref:Uncharacterized protein n=1 Tax=Caerostris darwini TaxID=1538125 RepID=A0AAV4PLS3_9ARAC|nr:hypothetical protein CDAR_23521 [Caerostris darwini]